MIRPMGETARKAQRLVHQGLCSATGVAAEGSSTRRRAATAREERERTAAKVGKRKKDGRGEDEVQLGKTASFHLDHGASTSLDARRISRPRKESTQPPTPRKCQTLPKTTNKQTCMYTYMYIRCVHTYIHICVHAYICIYASVYIYICIYMYRHRHIYIHIGISVYC